MAYKYWLLFGSLAVGAAQTVGCSSEFRDCHERRNCQVTGGAAGSGGLAGGGTAGAAHAGTGGSAEAVTGDEGGSAGSDAEGGEGGVDATVSGDDAGSGGMGGDGSVEMELEIAPPTLTNGKTYVPFTGKISASGAKQYKWSITSGSLPAGLVLQGVQTATVTIAGTPTQAGKFPITLSVTDGTTTESVDVTLGITHPVLFLSDRNIAGVNELFLAEIGAATVDDPVQLSATLPAGGSVTNYAWSPDGSKVLYVATQSSGGAAELWVASLTAPGIAQRVSAQGVSVSLTGWLGAGNIAAYATSTGDAYLVDLSGPTPGSSKLAITGSTIATGALAGSLQPSPDGTSVVVPYYFPMALGTPVYAYVTWTLGSPKVVLWNGGVSGFEYFSYDGRFVTINSSGGAQWVDLSLPSPSVNPLWAYRPGLWSPNADLLLYFVNFVQGDPMELRLGTFKGGTFASTSLAPSPTCTSILVGPWSPDGKNALLNCGKDLRGISDVAAAPVSKDFSLLPNAFLTNSFSDVSPPAWSPDSAWIATAVDRDVDKQNDLYLIRWSAPGAAYKAHANSIGNGVSTYAFAPNSQSVAFTGIISPQANNALYLTKLPASGAPAFGTLISSPANAIVQSDLKWLPGSRVLTYRASVSNAIQLFAVPVAPDGTAGTPISISGISGSGVSSYQLAPTHPL